MQFIAQQCAAVKYLLKCDDDTYVHIPRLALSQGFITETGNKMGLIWCLFADFRQLISICLSTPVLFSSLPVLLDFHQVDALDRPTEGRGHLFFFQKMQLKNGHWIWVYYGQFNE